MKLLQLTWRFFFWPGQKIFLPISVIWCAKHPRNTARCSSVCWSLFKFSHHKWISGTSHKLKPNNLGFDFGIYWHGFFTVWFWVQLALISYKKLIFNFTKKTHIFFPWNWRLGACKLQTCVYFYLPHNICHCSYLLW